MRRGFVTQLAESMRADAPKDDELPVIDPSKLTLVSIGVYSAPLAEVRAIAIAAKAEGKTLAISRHKASNARALVCVTLDGRRVHLVGV